MFLKLFYLLASFSGDISDVFVTGSEDTNIQLMICIQFLTVRVVFSGPSRGKRRT